MRVKAMVVKYFVLNCFIYVCVHANVACADDMDQKQWLATRQAFITIFGNKWNNPTASWPFQPANFG